MRKNKGRNNECNERADGHVKDHLRKKNRKARSER